MTVLPAHLEYTRKPRRPSGCASRHSVGLHSALAWLVPCAVAGLFLIVLAMTWQRWTVQAFPLDAGREVMVPRLIAEGRRLFADIRCHEGPMGYWIQAAGVLLLGPGLNALWWTHVARFTSLLLMIWMLGRRMVGPVWAALAMAAGIFPICFSFLVPYAAGVGWGAWFTTAGLLCAAGQLQSAGDDSPGRAGPLRPALTGLLLAIAITCKHEYALVGTLMLAVLIGDILVRAPYGRATGTAAAAMLLGAVLPLSAVAAVVVWTAPLGQTLHENLWPREHMDHYGGVLAYGPLSAFSRAKLIAMTEWAAIVGVSAAAVHLALCRSRCAPDLREPNRRARQFLWTLVGGGIAAIVLCEWATCERPGVGAPWLAYPRPRLRELPALLPLLCLPGCIWAVGAALSCSRRKGLRVAWRTARPEDRLAALGIVAYLAFLVRELPTGVELMRQPLTPLLLAWLLVRFLPAQLAWPAPARTLAATGTAMVLAAATYAGIDNIRFYEHRPAVMLAGKTGEWYAFQRRRPFTPAWFRDALRTAQTYEPRIAGRSIACVPEGAWVNALMGWDWPTRDTQWLGYFERWILEDLDRSPVQFLLVMEPAEMGRDLPRVREIIERRYSPIAVNASGMILYELQPPDHVPAVTHAFPH